MSDNSKVKLYVTLSLLVAVVTLVGFCYGRTISFLGELRLDTEVVGQYGDFIGGVVGTMVSVALLYYTFKLQRIEIASGQLHDVFFHLLSQYKGLLDDFSSNQGGTKGKEALRGIYVKMQHDFKPCPVEGRTRKNAIAAFLLFYVTERDFAPVYYRTLYRVVRIVDSADNTLNKNKIELIKVLRGQLTDIELLLLWYNLQLPQGKKFRVLVTKYNLLKHLPQLEKLEYSYWRVKIPYEDERSILSELLFVIRDNIKKVLHTDSHDEAYTFRHDRKVFNHVNVHTNEERTELTLKLSISCKKSSKTNLCYGLHSLSLSDQISLLSFFLKDCLLLSSFCAYNNYRDVTINDNIVENNSDYYKFNVVVKNSQHKLSLLSDKEA